MHHKLKKAFEFIEGLGVNIEDATFKASPQNADQMLLSNEKRVIAIFELREDQELMLRLERKPIDNYESLLLSGNFIAPETMKKFRHWSKNCKEMHAFAKPLTEYLSTPPRWLAYSESELVGEWYVGGGEAPVDLLLVRVPHQFDKYKRLEDFE